MRNLIHLLLGLLVISSSLAGCSIPSAPSASSAVPLRMEWTDWEGDYTAVIAQEKGFFEKYSVPVELVYYEVFSQAVPDLIAGKIDIGLFAVGDLINVAQRAGARAVTVYDSGGTSAVIATPNIQSPGDLTGKRVGVNPGTSGELYVREMLATRGMGLEDVQIVNVNPEDVPARLGVDIDAGYAWEPYLSQAVSAGNKRLFSSQDSQIANLIPDLIVFRPSILEDRPQEVRAFIDAWFEALEYRLAHPDECNQIIATRLGHPLASADPQLKLYNRADNLQLLAAPGASSAGRSIYDILNLHLEFLIQAGDITRPPRPEEMFDASFLASEGN